MVRYLKIIKRGLYLALAATSLALFVGLPFVPKAEAAQNFSHHFTNTSKWQLLTVEFTIADTTNGVLDKDLVSEIGGGDLNKGIATVNDYVKRLIQNGQAVWLDQDIMNDTVVWELNGCKTSEMRPWRIEKLYVNFPGVGCENIIDDQLLFATPTGAEFERVKTRFEWVDSRTIVRVDGQDGNFVDTDPVNFPGRFVRVNQDGEDNQDFLVILNPEGTQADYYPDGKRTQTWNVNTDNKGKEAVLDENGAPISASQLVEQETSCEGNDVSGFGWIGCMLIRAIDNTLGGIENQVNSIMRIDLAELQQDEKLYQVWSIVRNISSILLVLFAMIMVISTAIEIGPFDAYTIKKVLPRMVVAVILMQVSWSLMMLLIQITNEVGDSIKSLMLQPFGGDAGTSLGSLLARSGAGGQTGWFTGAASTAATGGAIVLGIAGILSLAATTFVGVLIGFLVLVLRNIVVLAAVVFAPFALVCYIVPGTEKFGKVWWDAFSKGLLMYPLIIVLFTSGRIFSYLAGGPEGASNNAFDDVFQFVIVTVSYVVPYFLVPATFKLAGGAIATLGGMANDRSRGFFDRARKKRGERIQHNIAKAKAGKRWDENTGPKFGKHHKGIGYYANKFADFGVEPIKYTGYHLGKEGSIKALGWMPGFRHGAPLMKKFAAHVGASIRNSGVDSTTKLFQKLNETGLFNDKAYAALAGEFTRYYEKANDPHASAKSRGQAKAVFDGLVRHGFLDRNGKLLRTAHSVKDFNNLADALAAGGQSGETEQIASNALRNSAGYLATIHEDPEFAYSSIEGAGAIGWAQHGFADGRGLANIANRLQHEGLGREGAHAIITKAQVLGQNQRPDIKAGYGVLYNAATGKFMDGLDFGVARNTDGSVHYGADGRPQFVNVNDRSLTRAKEWIRTVKQHDWLGAKAGAVQRAEALIVDSALEKDPATGGFSANAKALQESILLGASAFSSSDADAKVVWKRIADHIPGLTQRVQQSDQFRAISEAFTGGEGGGGGAAGGGAA